MRLSLIRVGGSDANSDQGLEGGGEKRRLLLPTQGVSAHRDLAKKENVISSFLRFLFSPCPLIEAWAVFGWVNGSR